MPKLSKYNKKRNFRRTAEPEGKVKESKGSLKFVIQKHQASRLHYDFRIEVDGVLKSWAVPKGLPTKSNERHLAMMVEDHPFDYRDFEGTIPEGNYGAGTVMVWDEGTYTHSKTEDRKEIQERIKEGIKQGEIKLFLNGTKLKGLYALVRFKKAGENAWLFIKDKDEFEGKKIKDVDLSVKTGRTLDEITDGVKAKKKVKKKKEKEIKISKNDDGFTPMLATLVENAFNDKDWIFEVKWDGYRIIAHIEKDLVNLLSRNTQNYNSDFSPIVEELLNIKDKMILDGEVVVVDSKGRSDFQALQSYRNSGEGKLMYYVFDILKFKNRDLRKLPLTERKEILKKVLPKLGLVKYSDHIDEEGKKFFSLAKKNDLEGIIAKKKDSIYESGERTKSWQKIKILKQQEVVIGGYTKPEGKRNEFGSLLMGVHKRGKLVYVGNTGSGFDEKSLKKSKHF